jgi:membrane protein DedA with SNARE-associated domain
MSPLGSFLETFGYLAVVVGTFFEGETVLVLAGLASHRGYLSLPAVIAAGFVGTLAGDQLYFQLGRRRGEAFLARRPRLRARIGRARGFLERHHVAFILGFRFLYGLRTVSPFAIGMSDVPFARYLLLNAIGALIWAVTIALLGYSVGQSAEIVLGRAREIEAWLFAGIAATGAIVWLVYLVRTRARRGEVGR